MQMVASSCDPDPARWGNGEIGDIPVSCHKQENVPFFHATALRMQENDSCSEETTTVNLIDLAGRLVLAGVGILLSACVMAAEPRARELGIPFPGTPGPLNAITDVAGVEVGYTTLIQGEGKLVVGKGPVRTGVTAILPRGRETQGGVFGAYAVGNGNGEMTGAIWVEDSGVVGSPVLITNTHSVGVVRDAVIAWMLKHGGTGQLWGLPIVAETWDGHLNDSTASTSGEHVFARSTARAERSPKAMPAAARHAHV
jgi:hypothetical protein